MFVCPCGVILFSLEHLEHLKQNVLRKLQGCLGGVCLNGILNKRKVHLYVKI